MSRSSWLAAVLVAVSLPVFVGPAAHAAPADADAWRSFAMTHRKKICIFIQRHPTHDGLVAAIRNIAAESGMSGRDSGMALGFAVAGGCPQYMQLLQETRAAISP